MKAKPDETNINTQRTFYKLWKNIRNSSPEIWQGNYQKHSSFSGTNALLIASMWMEIFFFNV